MSGGTGSDTISYATNTTGVGVIVDFGSKQAATSEGTDKLGEFEHIVGSPVGDQLYGDDRANTLVGAGGWDILVGEGGPDTLRATGTSTETNYFSGGAGDDVLQGGASKDIAR
jgi:hypothetical protein